MKKIINSQTFFLKDDDILNNDIILSPSNKISLSAKSSSKLHNLNFAKENYIDKKVKNYLADISIIKNQELLDENMNTKDLALNSDVYLNSENLIDSLYEFDRNNFIRSNQCNDKPKKLIKNIKTKILKSNKKESDYTIESSSSKINKGECEADIEDKNGNSYKNMLKLTDFGFKNKKFEHTSDFNIIELFDSNKIYVENSSDNKNKNLNHLNGNNKKETYNKDSQMNKSGILIENKHPAKFNKGIKSFNESNIGSDKMIEILNTRFLIKENLEKERMRTNSKYRSNNSFMKNDEIRDSKKKLFLSDFNLGKIKIITTSNKIIFLCINL